jgi:predicted ATPase
MIVAMATSASRTPQWTGSGEHNLPAPVTSLVGRERKLHGLREALRKGRLVTLGGVGKTRLAVEPARRQVARRRDGVWLVDLAAVGPETSDIPAETARVLDLRSPRGTTATDVLPQFLVERDLLLVLDNCEHVVEACAELADALLASCAGVRILATSREVLDVSGERVWRLDPLG